MRLFRFRPKLFNGLVFKIVSHYALVLVAVSFPIFYLADRLLAHYLIARIDETLETEVLVITSELDISGDQSNPVFLQEQLTRLGMAHGMVGNFFRILDERGAPLANSDLTHWPDIARDPIPLKKIGKAPFLWETLVRGTTRFRVIYYQNPEGRILQVGYNLQETSYLQKGVRRILVMGVFLVIIVGSILGWLLTRRALRGISQVSRGAGFIWKKGDLEYRVPTPTGSNETDELAETFNHMLSRIKDLVNNLNYVMDNIAHDIRTPVTRVRGHAEAQLHMQDLTEREMALCGSVVGECDQILNLVNTLLEITAAESGLTQWRFQRVDLVELVREGCDLFGPVAENKHQKLNLVLPEHCPVRVDQRGMQRVISNLLDNAIKYTPERGSIQIRLAVSEGWVCLSFTDSGIGIEKGEEELIFERFYRGDRSRSKAGNGLGLSFCRPAVKAMGGKIGCKRRPEGGSVFTVLLPGEEESGEDP